MNGDTCRVNLYVAGVCEVCTLAVALDGCSTVATHSVGREEVCVAITTSSDYHGVCREALELACNEVLGDNTASTSVNDYYVFHLVACVEAYAACVDLL